MLNRSAALHLVYGRCGLRSHRQRQLNASENFPLPNRPLPFNIPLPAHRFEHRRMNRPSAGTRRQPLAVALRLLAETFQMQAILGVLLLAAATVLFSWAFIQVRRPNPGAWADSDLAVQLVVFVWIVVLCAGVGTLAKAVETFESDPVTSAQYATIAAILVASGMLHYLLRRQWRRLKGTAGMLPADMFPQIPAHAAGDIAPVSQDNDPHSRAPRAA
jgi:hypothetical protein